MQYTLAAPELEHISGKESPYAETHLTTKAMHKGVARPREIQSLLGDDFRWHIGLFRSQADDDAVDRSR